MHPEAIARLRERAEEAPTSLRVFFDALQRSIPKDYPEAASMPYWRELACVGSVAGSFLLSVYLSREVEKDLRTDLETRMRDSLRTRWPQADELYVSLYEFVTEQMAPLSRAQRGHAMFIFTAEWMVQVIEREHSMPRREEVLATIAQFLMREIPGSWKAVQDYSGN